MDSYIKNMSRGSEWADDAAALTTAEALGIQINIISSDSDYVATLRPSDGRVSETIWVGLVGDFHY